ncbi:hypothetical protein PspCFBP13528_23380 [Pseudomonas sp. CFBP13528]|nr:hypothetical protein PspCFBP13528_23380 [Pseudomonas sp. CFBP13528]
MGAFNHLTGEQLKGPKKKRNIRKYLRGLHGTQSEIGMVRQNHRVANRN